MSELYTVKELVKMCWYAQRHDDRLEKMPPEVVEGYEFALQGFTPLQINDAFLEYVKAYPTLPSPCDIVLCISRRWGVQ